MRKIPTLFIRDPDDMRHLTRDVQPGCEWVLAGEGTPTRKYDGTGVMFDGERWWARREVKPDKSPPANFTLVETDDVTGKQVGWEPIEQSSFAKFHAEALQAGSIAHIPTGGAFEPGTYELVGPKINRNPESTVSHLLVLHGYTPGVDATELSALTQPTSLFPGGLTFDGIRDWLELHPKWEGIVWHHDDGRLAKIKGRDFT